MSFYLAGCEDVFAVEIMRFLRGIQAYCFDGGMKLGFTLEYFSPMPQMPYRQLCCLEPARGPNRAISLAPTNEKASTRAAQYW